MMNPDRNKKKIYVLLALAALFVILFLPTPPPITTDHGTFVLSSDAKACLAVLAMAVILWITEAMPFAMTGLLAIVVLVMTKAAPFNQLVQYGFGNPIILFFLGVLIFSAALSETSLLRRLSTLLLYHLGYRPKVMILIFLAIGALLSGWITDMAVAAMLTPVALTILKNANVKPMKSNFGRAMMISCAWGPLIGGVTTPAGCGPNPLTITFLKDLAGIDFGFIDWMLVGVPAAILMLPFAWLILLKVFPVEEINLAITEDDLHNRLEEIGPVTCKEMYTVAVFGLAIFLWISASWIKRLTGGAIDYLEISFVAIACACLLFLPGIGLLPWKKAEGTIAWGGIILVVSGLSLGMAIYKSGAASWLAWVAFHRIAVLHPIAQVFAIVLGVSLLKVIFSSNTVTGIIVVPLLIALATSLGIDISLIAIPAGITASLAFILVTSTPTNVIPYSAGYFSIADMAKAGLWMTIASTCCVTISVCFIGKLFKIVSW